MQTVIPPYPLFTDGYGRALEEGYIYVGTAGLNPETNPVTTYWDSAKTIPAAQPIRTKNGYGWRNGTPSLFFVDADDYSIAVRNRARSLVFSAANFMQFLTSVGGFLQSGAGAVQRSMQDKMREMVSPWDFTDDTVGLSSAAFDARPAFQAAITEVLARGGGRVWIPNGQYLIVAVEGPDDYDNGITIPFTTHNDPGRRVKLMGESRSARLLAGSNDMAVIRWSDGMGSIESLSIEGNGHTGVVGLAVVPDNMNQTSTVVGQSYNVFRDMFVGDCAEGIVLRCGPRAGSPVSDSSCWYNRFDDIRINNCTLGLWLRDGATARSNVNRNRFTNLRIGQGNANTGLQLDSGDTNEFHFCSFEGVEKLTSPNTRPTAVIIKGASAVGSGDNNSNRFFGCTAEGCELGLWNGNVYSEFYGCYFGSTVLKRHTLDIGMLVGDGITVSTTNGSASVVFSGGDLNAAALPVYGAGTPPAGNHLIIESGADAGTYEIVSITNATTCVLDATLTATASGINRKIESRKLSINGGRPRIMLGGYDAAGSPMITDFFSGQASSQLPEANNGTLYVTVGKLEFPATQLASPLANVLDDYKESLQTGSGVWTPTVVATGSTDHTYAIQRGHWQKVGRWLRFTAHVKLSALGTAGTIFCRITGLPYQPGSFSGFTYNPTCHVAWDNLTGLVAGNVLFGSMAPGNTDIGLYVLDQDGVVDTQGLNGANLTATSEFWVTGQFETAT